MKPLGWSLWEVDLVAGHHHSDGRCLVLGFMAQSPQDRGLGARQTTVRDAGEVHHQGHHALVPPAGAAPQVCSGMPTAMYLSLGFDRFDGCLLCCCVTSKKSF